MKRVLFLGALLFVILIGCRHHRPYVGEVLIDTDVPNKHDQLLLLGYTLDEGELGRNLLSQELIPPQSFILKDEYWQILGGVISFSKGTESEPLLVANIKKNDSIVGVRLKRSAFAVQQGDEFAFSAKASKRGFAHIEISLIDDSLSTPLSSVTALSITDEFSEIRGNLRATKPSERATLQIIFKQNNDTQSNIIDSLGTVRYSSSSVSLSNPSLKKPDCTTKYGLPQDLIDLLSQLSPDFLRFPSGIRAKKEFPIHLDSLLQKNSYRPKSFDYKDFIKLSESLSAVPILLTNIGYDVKPEYYSQLIKGISNPKVIIQLGYDSSGLDYFYRYHSIEKKLQEDSIDFHLINSGSILPFKKYSDYPLDRVLPPVEVSNLSMIDTLISNHNFLAEPQILGEVEFEDSSSMQYSIPPLVLRAAFMTLSERNSEYLEGIGVSPLLAEANTNSYPLIEVRGGDYLPTHFFQYTKLFSTLRGVNLKSIPSHQPFEDGLVLSLSADKEDQNYYLKAVNTTRHSLPYLIKAKGKKASFTSATIYTFRPKDIDNPKAPFKEYEFITITKRIGKQQRFEYLFNPFEIVIFHFK